MSYLDPLKTAMAEFRNSVAVDGNAPKAFYDTVYDFVNEQEKLSTMERLQQAFTADDAEVVHRLVLEVLVAHNEVNAMWTFPGEPSITDYVRQLVGYLRQRYDV